MTIPMAMTLSEFARAVPHVVLAVVLACGSSFAFNVAAAPAAQATPATAATRERPRPRPRPWPRPGPLHAFVWAPLVEEAAKTGFGMAVGAPLIPVHIGFGMAEGVHDALAHRRTGAAAALLSLVGHGIFGVVTFHFLASGWHPLLAMAAAAAVHALWNLMVVVLAPGRW